MEVVCGIRYPMIYSVYISNVITQYMKVLAIHSPSTSEKNLKVFTEGIKELKRQGHNVNEIRIDSKSLTKTFSALDKNIKDTDILIVEVTDADANIGYQIARALEEKKVVITMEDEKNTNKYAVVHGNGSKQLIQYTYNQKNIIETINEATKEAISKLDSKFILIISPEMDRYLNWASKVKRTHKAQLVRSALEALIKKDKEYKDYIEGNEV
jgi:hypothetical protein